MYIYGIYLVYTARMTFKILITLFVQVVLFPSNVIDLTFLCVIT